jgi:hypothetical protein
LTINDHWTDWYILMKLTTVIENIKGICLQGHIKVKVNYQAQNYFCNNLKMDWFYYYRWMDQ